MKFAKATRKYEAWLGRHTRLLKADLLHKHQAMAENSFSFFRATFYRWAQLWPKVCAKLAGAPGVLAVGDLHVENFGTWRDAEGRLAWGVNDFDEAYPMAYTADLVRLAASTILAIRSDHMSFADAEACDVILDGYRRGIEAGGKPFVVAENHRWFAPLIDQQARDPVQFWGKMKELPALEVEPPKVVLKILRSALPERDLPIKLSHRVAGLGSLGKPRFVAVTEWHGGPVAREAKALTRSACAWLADSKRPEPYYKTIMASAVRCPDPLFNVRGDWIVRRLSPDCGRVELTSLPKAHDDTKLLHAMGWETANVHLGSQGRARAILRDLKQRRKWLRTAAEEMLEATLLDWKEWRDEMACRADEAG
jgi:hypothetical protein